MFFYKPGVTERHSEGQKEEASVQWVDEEVVHEWVTQKFCPGRLLLE